MPKSNHSYYDDLRRLRLFIGNRCCYFSHAYGRCGEKRKLEFAHLRDQTIRGRGRGKLHRVLDIFRDLTNVSLLCRAHHMAYDSKYSRPHLLAAGDVINVFAMVMLRWMKKGPTIRGELITASWKVASQHLVGTIRSIYSLSPIVHKSSVVPAD